MDKVIKGRNCLDGAELLDNQDLCLLLKVAPRTPVSYTHLDVYKRQELKELRELGYDGITIGVETGYDESLIFMRKGFLSKDIICPVSYTHLVISHRTCSRKSPNVLLIWNSTPALPDMQPG